MDYIALLQTDIDNGFYKSDLEKLIGLPKNNLSGILKGDRKLSKKSILKIEKWVKSKKPDPLTLTFQKSEKKAKEPTVREEIKFQKSNKKSFDGKKNGRIVYDEAGVMSVKGTIPRLDGESYIDYRIRISELNG